MEVISEPWAGYVTQKLNGNSGQLTLITPMASRTLHSSINPWCLRSSAWPILDNKLAQLLLIAQILALP